MFLRKGWTGLYSRKGWVGYLPFCHTAGSLLAGLNTLQSLIEKQFEDQQQVLLSPPASLLAKFIQTESRSGSTYKKSQSQSRYFRPISDSVPLSQMYISPD